MKAADLKLYAVSACNAPAGELPEAQEGGATFLQLREKELDYADFLAKAKEIVKCAKVPFVINDNVQIALESGADGVHVGQSDASLQEVRAVLGKDKIVGVSCTRLAEALSAEKGGADYLGVGAVFPTGTKADAAYVSRNALTAITQSVKIPVVAIGGISLDNVSKLSGTGISGCAVVSALFGQGDIRKRTRRFAAENETMLACRVRRDKGAIVDADGVLLDSLEIWNDIDVRLLKKHGILSDENLEILHHSSTIENAAVTLNEKGGYSFDPAEFHREVSALLREAYCGRVQLVPGVKSRLESMKKDGVRLALLTASPEALVGTALKRLGVYGLFDELLFEKDKYDKECFYEAAERLGTGLPDCTVYDDSEYAQKSAADAGFKVLPAL